MKEKLAHSFVFCRILLFFIAFATEKKSYKAFEGSFYKRILGRKERETELKTKKEDRKSEKGAKTMNKSLLLFLSFDSWI